MDPPATSSVQAAPPTDVRLLVLLNPGRMSRHWLLAIATGAERLGILAGTLELGPIWQAIERAGINHAQIRLRAAEQIRALCHRARVTHVLSYTHNAVFDFGVAPHPATGSPQGLFPSLNIDHLLLWSDHPNWASAGAALSEPMSTLLNHPRHHHFVKSTVSAQEIRSVLGWQNVQAINMAEDTHAFLPDRAVLAREPLHDAVIIMGDSAPIPTALEPFLAHDDPDPRDIMRALLQPTLNAIESVIAGIGLSTSEQAMALRFACALAGARIEQPGTPYWQLIDHLSPEHDQAITLLRATPNRWFQFVHSLHALTGWRRFFWPAWLARRADVAVYGSPASRMGLADHEKGQWISNEQMPNIYARAACAININAAHDEAGMTHKPFQIACSGVPMLHHATEGLTDAFAPDDEVFTWTRGPELLNAVRRLRADNALRQSMGDQARARCEMEHDWEHRLPHMLSACAQAARLVAVA